MMPRVLVTLFLLSPALALSQIYQCKDNDGKVRFQQTACEEGEKEQQMNLPNAGKAATAAEGNTGNTHRNMLYRARKTEGTTKNAAQDHAGGH